jgi:glycosyltransferase involved in cell wall biosynthesis
MRLLYLNHNVSGSGTFRRAFNLGREMVRRGHEVTVVTTSRSARVRASWTEREGVRVLEAPDLLWGPGRTGWDPYNVVRRMGVLAGSSYDLVHAFDCRPAVIFPALAAARAGASLFIDWADWWGRGGTIEERSGWVVRTFFGPIETWFEESFRTRAAGATVISSALRERCIALGVPAEGILHLPDGSGSRQEPRVDRAHARTALGLDGGPLLVHVGTAHPGDAALMFEALRRARREEPRLRLVLAGMFRGTAPADLLAAGAVQPTGFLSTDALHLWLAAADACVVALRDNIANRGRWPSKVNEYLAAGRATVMTDVSDFAVRVRASGAGRVSPPDADALAAAMVETVRDAAGRAAAERNALELAATLAWGGLAERLDGFYTEVLARRVAPLGVSA